MDEEGIRKKSVEDTMKKKEKDSNKKWESKRSQIEKELFTLQQNLRHEVKKKSTNSESSYSKSSDSFVSLEEKNLFLPLLSIFLCLLFAGGIYFFLQGGLTGGATFDTITAGDFGNGTFLNTFYNTTSASSKHVQLYANSSFASYGNYTSNVSNVGNLATWNNISFVTNALGELAANQVDEVALNTYGAGNINMSLCQIYYRFDNDTTIGENSTHVRNLCNEPTNYNATWYSPASNGTVLSSPLKSSGEFNGTNALAVIGTYDPLSYGTVMFWLLPHPNGVQQKIFGFNDSFEGVISAGNILSNQLFQAGTVVNPTWTLNSGTWYHVAMTWGNGTNNRTNDIYINGRLNFSTTSAQEDPGKDVLTLGNSTTTTGSYFKGALEEFVIFKKVMSAADIMSVFERGATRFNLSVRSCDDAACSGETYTDINDTSPQAVSPFVSNNQFFQYNFEFIHNNPTIPTVMYGSPRLYNISLDYTSLAPPKVTEQIPSANSAFNITNVIQIAANVTDGGAISKVFANISYPNGSTISFELSNGTGYPTRFNMSFTLPELLGNYNITFQANDSSNNMNVTEKTNFTINLGCATVTRSNNLNQDLTAVNTCFNISANNVEINCLGKRITYGISSAGNAFNNSGGYDNITIRNCFIRTGSVSGANNSAMYFSNGAFNATLTNNTIFTDGTSDNYGIFFAGGSNSSTAENNTIITNGSSAVNYGIYLLDAANNTFTGNNVSTNGTTNNYGIRIIGFSGGNVVRDNQIAAGGTGRDNYAIRFESGTASPNQTLLINNNLTSNTGDFIIRDDTSDGEINFLVYNNTFGEMRWIDNGSGSFVRNLTLNITNNLGLGLGRNIFIGNNTLAFNSSAPNVGKINGSLVNLSLFGINLTTVNVINRAENFTTDAVQIRAAGVNCIGASTFPCVNISYIGNTLRFNSSSFSSFAGNASSFATANNLPTPPVTLIPANGSSPTNRTPTFTWGNSTDADGDVISYHLQVDDNIRFNNPEINISAFQNTIFNSANTTYFSSSGVVELAVDTKYYWRVRANDSTGYGAWSDGTAFDGPSDGKNLSNFTVNSLLSFTFTNTAVEFGELARGTNTSTVSGTPRPLRAENTGNIEMNISINASPLFISVPFNSSYYQFKIRANESNAFYSPLSSTNWINMSNSTTFNHVVNLSWRNVKNDFLTDVNISLPWEEYGGLKTSTMTFTVTGYSS